MKTVTFASLRRALSRPLVLHPRSLLAGTALGVVSFFAMSQAIVSPPANVLRVEYLPHPRDVFRIEESTQYTVPTGSVFVLTGVGRRTVLAGNAAVSILANGIPECAIQVITPGLTPGPPSMTFAAGTVLTLLDSSSPVANDCYATGYLVTK